MSLQRFIEELQRRHVFRVAGGYLVASWVAIEVTSTVLPLLGRSESGATWVLYAAIAGIPFMLLLAWFFDFTKEGIIRTPAATPPLDATERLVVESQGVTQAPRRVVLSTRATGMFGLGALVAIVSLAAYSRAHTPAASANGLAAEDSAALSNIRAIAVLPFTDLSQERNQGYFAEGMTEELLNRLAQVQGLQVVSGRAYASTDRGGDISGIANALRVQAVLEGSVRKAADSLRVTIKLINPATNTILYVEQFTRPTANVFEVQDEIAASVADALQLHLSTGVVHAAGNRGTTNEQAYELYTRGMDRLRERTDRDLREALGYFEEAIRQDPKFALAYAGLAQTYAVLPTVGSFDFELAGTKGTLAAGQAIGLDPSLGQASAALGQIMQNLGWDPAAAEVQYKRAIEFAPNNATAHQWYAETLTMLGRTDEALKEIRTALQLEPFSPAAKNTLGYLLTVRGELDSALVVFRNEATLYPSYSLGHLTRALTALAAKRYDEAETAAVTYAGSDKALATAFTTVVRGAAGTAPHADAVKAATSLEARLGPGFSALWFAAIGENKTALALVQKTYAARKDANFPYFVIHPLLKPLHGDPAYQKVIAEMGVSPAQ